MLSFRYQTNLSKAQQPPQQRVHHNSGHPYVEKEWQILIKIAGTKRKRCAYAYEARNLQGNIIFTGAVSCAAKTASGATQEALMEAITKFRDLGYQRILVFM